MPGAKTDRVALVVDDNPFNVLDAVDILERAGFRCFEASTGDHARVVLDRHHDLISLLFSDIEMPGDTDGVGLAWYVADHWPEIEIILASGRYLPDVRELPAKTKFIPKPFSDSHVYKQLAARDVNGIDSALHISKLC